MKFITHKSCLLRFVGCLPFQFFVGCCSSHPYLMIRLILLFLLELYFGPHNSSQIKDRIPELMKQLCPKSNICRGSYSILDQEYDQDATSCCTDCSCEANCNNVGDCCFVSDARSTYPEFDTGGMKESDDNRECLFTVTGKPKQNDFQLFRSYRMYTNENCDSKNVAPREGLFPVFSKQTTIIYKNKMCAKAADITDHIFWDAIFTCSSLDIDTVTDLERDEIRSDCRVYFKYPGSLDDIKSEICFKDMIKNCTGTKFEIPRSVNSTEDEIREACESGIVSPYFGDPNNLYANVFCFICSGSANPVREHDTCPRYDDIVRGPGRAGFMALLNQDLFDRKTETFEQISIACPTDIVQNTSGCRPLLCPTGQIRHNNGECFFTTKAWYNKDYSVAIELKSEQNLNIKELFQLQNEYFISNFKQLSLPSLPRLKPWIINQAFYEKVNLSDCGTMKSLLVYVKRSFVSSDPQDIIGNIRLLMSSKWSIEYKNKTAALTPSPFKLKYPYTVNADNSQGMFVVNDTFSVRSPLYKHFYYAGLMDDGLLVTKIFFCEQIELEFGEFVLSEDRIVLYNKIGQNYLFDAEFVFVSEDAVRICLENSGFTKTIQEEMPKDDSQRHIPSVIAVSLLVHIVTTYFDADWLILYKFEI